MLNAIYAYSSEVQCHSMIVCFNGFISIWWAHFAISSHLFMSEAIDHTCGQVLHSWLHGDPHYPHWIAYILCCKQPNRMQAIFLSVSWKLNSLISENGRLLYPKASDVTTLWVQCWWWCNIHLRKWIPADATNHSWCSHDLLIAVSCIGTSSNWNMSLCTLRLSSLFPVD